MYKIGFYSLALSLPALRFSQELAHRSFQSKYQLLLSCKASNSPGNTCCLSVLQPASPAEKSLKAGCGNQGRPAAGAVPPSRGNYAHRHAWGMLGLWRMERGPWGGRPSGRGGLLDKGREVRASHCLGRDGESSRKKGDSLCHLVEPG